MSVVKHYVYKITNLVNGKVYIGKSVNPKARWGKHLSSARKKKKEQYFYLHRSINKYGAENFVVDIIDSADSAEEAYDKEKYWVKIYKSNDKDIGMNLTEGGDGTLGHTLSPEALKRMSEAHKGVPMPEATRQAIIKANTGRKFTEEHKNKIGAAQSGPKNHRYGKKLSEEARARIGASHRGKKLSPETIEKMRQSGLKRYENNPMPQEIRDKISAARVGKASEFGENHHAAKLNDVKVLKMRELYSTGEYSYSDLAVIFGVGYTQVQRIITGKRWGHLPLSTNKNA